MQALTVGRESAVEGRIIGNEHGEACRRLGQLGGEVGRKGEGNRQQRHALDAGQCLSQRVDVAVLRMEECT